MWKPLDYATRGDLCPVEDVRRYLGDVRGRVGLPILIMLASGRRATIPALTLVSGDSEPLARAVVAYLQSSAAVKDINRLAVTLAFSNHDGSGAPRLAPPELSRVIKQAVKSRRNQAFRIMILGWPVSTERVQVRPLMLGLTKIDSTEPISLTEEDAERLLAMLNATTQALTHVDESVMDDVDESMTPELDENGIVDFVKMAHGIADLAVRITQSDRAAVYMRTPGRTTSPALIAEAPRGWPPLSTTASDVETFVERVLRTHRAEQLRTLAASWLAAPIPGGLASPQASAIGVLWIGRQAQTDFSTYDLALTRNMCLRLAVLQSTAAAGRIARSITDLRSVPIAAVAAMPAPTLVNIGTELPPDVELALRRAPTALESIARSSNSHSVTIRVALPDPETGEPHGLVLRRAAAFPPERLSDPNVVLHQDDGGLNWQTVITGRVHYAPDIDHEINYRECREGTRSELAVPIRSEGRLLGTMNLESVSLSNYAALIPQALAFAGAIGRAFADAEAFYSQPVLERAAEILDHGHDYEENLRRLGKSPDLATLNQDERATIEKYIAQGLELITNTTRQPRDMDVPSEVGTVWGVFRAAYNIVQPLLFDEPDWSNAPAWDQSLVLDGEQARLVFSAFKNILVNLKKYSGNPGLGNVENKPTELVTGKCTWAGRDYAAVSFRNTSIERVPGQVALRAYRVPFPGTDGKIRLGSYLAALRIKQVGGLMSFAVNDRGRRARTNMLIPLRNEDTK